MRVDTVETKVYKFNELSDEAKEQAINKLYDINVDHEWWENTFYAAESTAILQLISFSTSQNSYCDGKFIEGAEETAAKIISEHGGTCATWLTATEYTANRKLLVIKHSDGIATDIVAEDNEYDFDKDCDELDAEFLRSILGDYLTILSKEYDYLVSEEAIIETIEANEYDFTVDGLLY